jgi:Trm5-related predicted tRNA methylase
VGLVPLTEGGSVDLDDGAFNEGIGSNEFVVGGIVDLNRNIRSAL